MPILPGDLEKQPLGEGDHGDNANLSLSPRMQALYCGADLLTKSIHWIEKRVNKSKRDVKDQNHMEA